MSLGILAHRYARALVDLAQDQGILNQIDTELKTFQQISQDVPELQSLLSDVILPRHERRRILTEVLERMEASELFKRYAKFLLEKERFVLYPALVRAFDALRDAAAGLVRAKVFAPQPLGSELRARIEQLLADKTGKTVAVEFCEDPSLIGGLVIQLGSRVYDGSINGELARAQEGMVKGVSL